MPPDPYGEPVWSPTYRLTVGRPPPGAKQIFTKHVAVVMPFSLLERAQEHCKDPDVAQTLSGTEGGHDPARIGDFIRSAVMLQVLLFDDESNRTRLLDLYHLPDLRMRDVICQIAFQYAARTNHNPQRAVINPDIILPEDPRALVDTREADRLEKENVGYSPPPPGQAPMTETEPWLTIEERAGRLAAHATLEAEHRQALLLITDLSHQLSTLRAALHDLVPSTPAMATDF